MEIHGLVAEAMILANASVGKRIYDGFKDAAILRHHPPPSPRQFEKLVKAAESKVCENRPPFARPMIILNVQ